LSEHRQTRPAALIIGVGNPLRRDDGAGPAVVRQLLNRLPKSVAAIEHHGESVSLIQAWQEIDTVLIVDAAFSGAIPGTVYRFNAGDAGLPKGLFSYSCHLFGVAEAVEMARSLGQLPQRLIVYGIEGGTFTHGQGLSPQVARAVKDVAEAILSELDPP
jgi:hydrogenase maturation protease